MERTFISSNGQTVEDVVYTDGVGRKLQEIQVHAAPDGTLSLRGYYPSGTLQKTTVTDEDGHTAVTYTDNRDREVLQAAATANENYLPSGTKTPMQYCVYDSYAPTTEVTPHAFTLIQGYAAEFNPTPSGLATSVKTRLLGTDQWQTLTTYYDSFARPVQVIRDNVHGKTTRVDTQYDFSGNIVKQAETHVMPDGTGQVLESVNTYDARGRLLSVTSSLNGGTEATVTYAYDETGRAIAKQYGGTQEAISYNVRGWITAKESTPFSMRLRYENPQAGATACYNGNISEWGWQHEDASPMMYGFTYDAFGRMNAAVQMQKSGQNWSTLAQDYTEKGITYDRNGNILTLQRTAAGNLVDNLVYGYDGNQLTSLNEKVRTSPEGDIFLPGSTEQAAYEYDANGNMKKDYRKGLQFGYNFLNLVSDVWHNDTVKVRYQYLADGTKWSIRDASGNNGYDYDGSFVYKVQNGQPVFEKATALDVQFCNGQALYALTDQLGSTRVLIDAQGEVVQQNDFYPFGAKALKSGYAENDNRFLFSGKEQQNMLDVNTYDFGARMYDAAIARWTCVDPMGEKHINRSPYNYCENNPMAFVDPDGRDVLITIVGNTITISANIIFCGSLATEELIEEYEQSIKDSWFHLNTYNDGVDEYNIYWDINITRNTSIDNPKGKGVDYNGINNYIFVYGKEEDNTTGIINSNYGFIRNYSKKNLPIELDNPMGHEFGHLLGLKDRYNKDGKPESSQWENNIMVNIQYEASEKNLDFIFREQPQFIKHSINNIDGKAITTYYINFYNREK